MANLKYISSFIIFGQTRGIKWTVPGDFLAKMKQLSFYGLLRSQLKRAFYYFYCYFTCDFILCKMGKVDEKNVAYLLTLHF